MKLFVSRQMEAASLVSCREDISSLFPEQTLDAKNNVGYSAGVGCVLQVVGATLHNNPTYCPLLGVKQTVFLREKSARGWKLLLQSLLLRILGVSPTQYQGSAEVSLRSFDLKSF